MERPRPQFPRADLCCPSSTSVGESWAKSVCLPDHSRDRPLLRADADTVIEATSFELRSIMDRVALIAAKWACGDIVFPLSVSGPSVGALATEWRRHGDLSVARNSLGEFLIKSGKSHGSSAGHFAIVSRHYVPLVAGIYTDRSLEREWPLAWRDYTDCKDKRLLDHCCGGGSKVTALRESGIDAHGVDVCNFGPNTPSFLHYGRAERLPFVDGAFDRVESRMGALVLSQDQRQVCREALAEMVRVAADGATIRIVPVNEQLLRDLVAERRDVFFIQHALADYGVFELVVRRTFAHG